MTDRKNFEQNNKLEIILMLSNRISSDMSVRKTKILQVQIKFLAFIPQFSYESLEKKIHNYFADYGQIVDQQVFENCDLKRQWKNVLHADLCRRVECLRSSQLQSLHRQC